MAQSTDDRLRIEAAQRDPSRFADLYEENFYRVYAYIARRVGDRHQAEDLTADVFREALGGIGKFEWRGVPFAGVAAAESRRELLRITLSAWAGMRRIWPRRRSRRLPTKSSAAPCCFSWWIGSRRRSFE